MISGAITVPLVVILSTMLRSLADSDMVLNGIRKSKAADVPDTFK
jgi:hypothetical protein